MAETIYILNQPGIGNISAHTTSLEAVKRAIVCFCKDQNVERFKVQYEEKIISWDSLSKADIDYVNKELRRQGHASLIAVFVNEYDEDYEEQEIRIDIDDVQLYKRTAKTINKIKVY